MVTFRAGAFPASEPQTSQECGLLLLLRLCLLTVESPFSGQAVTVAADAQNYTTLFSQGEHESAIRDSYDVKTVALASIKEIKVRLLEVHLV